jgi:hypothetical protein
MTHRFKILSLLVLLSVVAAAASLAYFRADRGPTTEEFRVYSAFLKHLAAETQQQYEFSLASKTLELADPQYDSWIPVELRSDRTRPSSDLMTFCGLCGRDFVRKNLAVWRLNPNALNKFGISVMDASESSWTPTNGYVVNVTRVGFDLWHHRSVLSYSLDCSGGATPGEDAVLCMQSGDVQLEKVRGTWLVKRYSAHLL